MQPQYLYHCDFYSFNNNYKIYFTHYHVIRETRCGYWFTWSDRLPFQKLYSDSDGPAWKEWVREVGIDVRWVSKTSVKRIAYPTKKEALTNFVKRKEKYIKILKNNIEITEGALYAARKYNLEKKILPEKAFSLEMPSKQTFS